MLIASHSQLWHCGGLFLPRHPEMTMTTQMTTEMTTKPKTMTMTTTETETETETTTHFVSTSQRDGKLIN